VGGRGILIPGSGKVIINRNDICIICRNHKYLSKKHFSGGISIFFARRGERESPLQET